MERLLAAIYRAHQKLDDASADKQCQQDFVFHMTDWIDDLHSLAALYERPESFTRSEAESTVAGFLFHVIPHLMEAGRIMLDYEPGYFFDSPKPKKGELSPKPSASRQRRTPSPARR